jgi:hypothetical protein
MPYIPRFETENVEPVYSPITGETRELFDLRGDLTHRFAIGVEDHRYDESIVGRHRDAEVHAIEHTNAIAEPVRVHLRMLREGRRNRLEQNVVDGDLEFVAKLRHRGAHLGEFDAQRRPDPRWPDLGQHRHQGGDHVVRPHLVEDDAVAVDHRSHRDVACLRDGRAQLGPLLLGEPQIELDGAARVDADQLPHPVVDPAAVVDQTSLPAPLFGVFELAGNVRDGRPVVAVGGDHGYPVDARGLGQDDELDSIDLDLGRHGPALPGW